MKPMHSTLAALLSLVAFTSAVSAGSLRNVGVLGNSGEQGESLVSMGPQLASGIGVVFDETGALWDRAGVGVLNRYTVDGRQIASYRIASSTDRRDTLTRLGDTLLIKLRSKLYTLPVTADLEAKPTALSVEATQLSLSSIDGRAAAARGNQVFWINAKGETSDIATLAAPVDEIEVGPGGSVYVRTKSGYQRIDPEAPEGVQDPVNQPGERSQWLDGYWYGHSWHGTIRRFNRALNPTPGVVLGGGSGAFIGYVPGNHELDNGRGMAHLRDTLFAVSGINGVLHLMEWHPVDQRFVIIRRIGAVRANSMLALDAKGRVWHDGGVWNWHDNPDTPVHHSVPGASSSFGATVMSNDVLVAPAFRWGRPCLYTGRLDGPASIAGDVKELHEKLVASTVLESSKRRQLIVVDAAGNGFSYKIGTNGKASGHQADPVLLAGSHPITDLTSLTALDADTLVVAEKDSLITFTREGEGWSESARRTGWGQDAAQHFGKKIHATASKDCLWVADSERHRVLCLDAKTGDLLASFGQTDQPGNDLMTLNTPSNIAANGDRAVVFDSVNQRLVRLELIR